MHKIFVPGGGRDLSQIHSCVVPRACRERALGVLIGNERDHTAFERQPFNLGMVC